MSLKKGKVELREFLENRQIIPPSQFSATEFAKRMTKADAKLLVQELIKLYPSDPSRLDVFKVLYQQSKEIVAKMKSAHQSQPQPAAKAS